jgi:Arc/MetJ-type ribon-helix-helix transcriptional regulator
MSIEVSPELEKLVDEKVASGELESREAVVSHALRLLYRESAGPKSTRAERLAAIERIRERRKGITLGPDLTIRQLIDEGRRY